MAETDTKIRKKVYSEVVARISFVAADEPAAMRVADHFIARRGITARNAVGYTRKSTWGSETRADFEVTYRVHGGWRSDFVRKIEYDASDTGVKIKDLEIEISRTEIPNECPRKNCQPCSYAVNPELRFIAPQDRPREPDTVEPGTQPEPDIQPERKPSKFTFFRR